MTWLKQTLGLILILATVGGGSYYWYFYIHKKDGVSCERDIHCPNRLCLTDHQGNYCSRLCDTEEECSEGWRCLRPPRRNTTRRGCVRPRLSP